MATITVSRLGKRRMVTAAGVMNAMLLFVPLAVLGELVGMGPVFVFACAALSCIPLSYWLGQATEVLGARLGPVSGGLLNATFGNAAEMIISVFALSQGLFIVVRTALIGSILGQLLLVLGTSLVLAGLRHGTLRFSRALVQVNFTLMVIAFAAIGLPSFLIAMSPEGSVSGMRFLIPTLSIILLAVYGLTVLFSLRAQPAGDETGGRDWTPSRSMLVLAASTGGMILVSEFLVGSIVPFIEATGISQVFIGLIVIPIFGNVVDHIVAITVALKNKMDLSLTISVGSAAQVACLVLPLVVLTSVVMGQPMGLVFEPIELIALALGLVLMVPVLLDGSSNWLEGTQLLTCYLILGAVLWAM